MFCREENRNVPDRELRAFAGWGMVHVPTAADDGVELHPHTLGGTTVPWHALPEPVRKQIKPYEHPSHPELPMMAITTIDPAVFAQLEPKP